MFDRLRQNMLRSVRDELVALVDAVSPSVVTIRMADAGMAAGSGSGWLLGDGMIVTNAHVVAGVDPVFKARLKGGDLVPATLIGADPATDLALLRADVDLPPLELSKRPADLGELCFAFGSPLGDFPETVTFGVVSGLGRRLPQENGQSIEAVLQTDAEINPGNSGGPLVDLDGQVLGVNTAIRMDGRGVGFAIPANTAASILPELAEHGEIRRPRLGVTIDVVEHRWDGVERERLRVASSEPDNPLRAGDVLITLAHQPLTTRADLFNVLRRPLIGTTATALVERSGEEINVDISFSK